MDLSKIINEILEIITIFPVALDLTEAQNTNLPWVAERTGEIIQKMNLSTCFHHLKSENIIQYV